MVPAADSGTAPETFLLAQLLAGADDAPALLIDGYSVSRAQLAAAAAAAAKGLAGLGLQRGDVLALWLPNCAGWLQLLFAAARLGVLIVPISTRYKAPEVRHLLTVSRARAIVAPVNFLDTAYASIAHALQAEVPTLERVIAVDDLSAWLPFRAGADPEVAAPGTAADPLCCFSTSGTTGMPKLAVHDHYGIARHAVQVARALDIRPGDAMLCSMPLFGVYGFFVALAALAGGARCVFLPVFDATAAAQAIERHRITHFIGADSMFDEVLRLPDAQLGTWRRGVLGDFVGLATSATLRADQLGISLSGVYGSSECFSLMSLFPVDMAPALRARGGGVVVDPAIHWRVVDPHSGAALADGEPGELQIRGPNLMTGYLNNPEASAKAMTDDGWFRSGDLAIGEGNAFIYLARMGDSLRLRGFLVSPAEIENCLTQHPTVALAQVVGVHRPGNGDIAVAYVIAAADAGVPLEEVLLAHCRGNMASYKVPRRVIVVDEFPSINGPNGNKIQKRVLREMAQTVID